MTSESIAVWAAAGRTVSAAGHQVFVREAGPNSDPCPVVILHGFPTSSHDWSRALPRLSENRRCVLFDLPGFGLSDKPADYSYSLLDQAEVALDVLAACGVEACHLVAHDMGTSVACELVARREEGTLPMELRSLALCNGSVYIELARLTPSQRLLRTRFANLFARVGSRRIFAWQLRRICGPKLRAEDIADMWQLLVRAEGKRRLPQIMSYIQERRDRWHRWIEPLTRLDLPTLILWGPQDGVSVAAIAERLAADIPAARLQWLPGLGHYPQLEDPDATAHALLEFMTEVERSW